jgi:hypothetical protein
MYKYIREKQCDNTNDLRIMPIANSVALMATSRFSYGKSAANGMFCYICNGLVLV